MKAFITGGAGFIGSHLTQLLLSQGIEVSGIVDDLSTGEKSRIPKGAIFHNCDIRDKDNLLRFMKGSDWVFHLAAQARIPRSWDYPRLTWDVNVNGTYNILEMAREAKVKRVMVTSSSTVYGPQFKDRVKGVLKENMTPIPLNPYAYHKLFDEQLAEMYSNLYGLDTYVVRPFNVYGPHQLVHANYSTVIPKFIQQWKKGEELTVYGDGSQARDFTHVYDIIEGMYQLMTKAKGFGIFNLSRGVPLTVLEVAKMFGVKYNCVPSPRHGEMQWTYGSTKKLYHATGFKPKYNLKNFIKEVVDGPV